ncbi:MAG TPA: hypothetical protein VIH57_01605, partial [Bacteroidales bacterium]
TNKPLTLHKSVLYFSNYKWFTRKRDSLVIVYKDKYGTPDSINFDTIPKYPVYLMLKLDYSDRTRKSNTFYFTSGKLFYDVMVGDTAVRVRPKLAGNNFSYQSSLKGVALIIEALLEMIIALMISRAFGLSRLIVLMVLAANIAAFPLYMANISSFFLRETLVFIVKAVVMILMGLRKIHVYNVLIILIALTIISFGLKELLFFLARII